MMQLLPLPVRQAGYRRRFLANREENLFMGSFESFEAAQAAAPPSKPVGYDNDEASSLYSHQTYFYDYPALFWLGRAMDEGLRTVFDLGGHVGIKYYAFRRSLPYPEDLRWTVCDVPAVVKAGRTLAQERGAHQLGFTTEPLDASGCDVLFASGSLQYLPCRLGELIAAMPRKPRRIVLNTTAVHPNRTVFTLNSIGFAVCPYRIQHHEELLAEIADAGYRRRDNWRNEGKPIAVPFIHEGELPYYAGGCFELKS